MRFVYARSAAMAAGALWVFLGVGSERVMAQSAMASESVAAEPRGELTLRQAVAASLERNPDLVASVYGVRVADAQVMQAGLRPNPEVSAQLDNFAGTGSAQGVRGLEATLSLSQLIELHGKRDLRVSVATADRDLAAIDQQAVQLDVLAEVTRRFVDVIAAQERVALANSNADLAQQTLDAISARVAAARSPRAEGNRARIVLTKAQLDVDAANSDLRGARQSLAAMWGSADPTYGTARADFYTFDDLASFQSLESRLDATPEFLRFASESRLRQAELRLAQAQARPDMTLGLGVRRIQDTRDQALVAQFSMPLAIRNRNQGAVRAAELRGEASAKERAAAFVRARATLYALYQQLTLSRNRLQLLTQQAVPQAEVALQETQTGYNRGRFSFLELSTAQQDLLSLREAQIAAAKDFHQTRAEIERLTNAPVSTGTP